jgi:outer membrane cobalamin receptor
MKKVLLKTLFFFSYGILSFAQQSYNAVSEAPLIEVLSMLESKNQITFSYDNDNVEKHSVSIPKGNFTLQQVLNNVFDQTDLSFEFIDNKYILLTKKVLNSKLNFLCGYLKDKDSHEPLIYASICNQSMTKVVESDLTGYFKIDLSDLDEFVIITYLGYESLTVDLANITADPCQDYFIGIASLTFEPIILKEYLADGINQTDNANTVVIEPNAMSILPGSVEKDVLAAISFLPGITSPGESLDGIYVRGGTPDQNLILWDGIPMYHSSHFFGTISAFNPNIIDHVNVHRSGIGSEYGGRVSSVIDIHSNQEITKNFKAGVGFNLTHINIDFDIPLWKNSSLMFSTRRSITDVWNTPTFIRYAEKVFQGTKVEESNFNDPSLIFSDEFKFNDANLKWMMDYGKNKFRFTSLGTLNSLNYKANIERLNLYSVDLLNLTNAGANLSWERQWNKNYSTKLEFTNAEYKYDYNLDYRNKEDNMLVPYSFDSQNSITDGGLKWTNNWKIKENQDMSFGYQYTENKVSLDISVIELQDSMANNIDLNHRVHALYGDYTLRIPETLQLDIGLRYLYQDILQNNYFEPRIALATNVTDKLKLKISTGKHFQFVSQLVAFNTNNLGLNNQFWVTANNSDEVNDVTIPVIESNQWMGGFIYQNGSWTFDVEGYVKELVGITTFSSSFFDLNDKQFSSGNSRIRGIDFLIKKRIDRYRSWVSYSISKTKYEFPAISLEPIIASHDQTHIFKWVHLYKVKAFEFSFGIEYRSGLPTTEAFVVDNKIQYGNPPNNLRLQRYFRLDGSIIYNFGSPNSVNGFIGFSLQNISNKNNILGRNYILDGPNGTSNSNLLRIDELGLKLTPNISVNIRMN